MAVLRNTSNKTQHYSSNHCIFATVTPFASPLATTVSLSPQRRHAPTPSLVLCYKSAVDTHCASAPDLAINHAYKTNLTGDGRCALPLAKPRHAQVSLLCLVAFLARILTCCCERLRLDSTFTCAPAALEARSVAGGRSNALLVGVRTMRCSM